MASKTPVSPAMPGVEIHAQVLESALSGAVVWQPNYGIALEFFAALILGLLVIAFAPNFGPVTLVLVGGLFATALAGTSWFFYTQHKLLVDFTYPLISTTAIYLTLIFASFVREPAGHGPLLDERPTAVYCDDDLIAAGLYLAARERGVRIPLGKAHVARTGKDVTVVSYGRAMMDCAAVADKLAGEDVQVELIDLRTLSPLDIDTVVRSVKKTNRVIVAHEAVRFGGFGAEVAAHLQALDRDRSQAIGAAAGRRDGDPGIGRSVGGAFQLEVQEGALLVGLGGERAAGRDLGERFERARVAPLGQRPGLYERREEAGIDDPLARAQDLQCLPVPPGAKLAGDDQQPEVERGLGDRQPAAELERQPHVAGGDGADTVIGSGSSDDIYGNGGNDVLHGDAGNDNLQGGAGDDIFYDGAGVDMVGGGDGFASGFTYGFLDDGPVGDAYRAAGVERRRLLEYKHARDAIRASGRGQGSKPVGQLRSRRFRGKKDQRADFAPALAGDHDVAHQRREMLDEACAQRADVHPGAGRELEIFRHPAAEKEPARGIALVQRKRIAEPVIALLVECSGGELGLAPVVVEAAALPLVEQVVLVLRHRTQRRVTAPPGQALEPGGDVLLKPLFFRVAMRPGGLLELEGAAMPNPAAPGIGEAPASRNIAASPRGRWLASAVCVCAA